MLRGPHSPTLKCLQINVKDANLEVRLVRGPLIYEAPRLAKAKHNVANSTNSSTGANAHGLS